MGGYNLAKELASYFLDHVNQSLDRSMANYDNILILGDLNCTASDVPLKNVCELYDLENLIKEATCYKNANNPNSIDVMLTNGPDCFHNSIAIETGLSDHHKMIITVLKIYSKKREPITINYRSYKRFDISKYKNDLKQSLERCNQESMKHEDFHNIFMIVLDVHAPMKQKIVRGNNAPFMTKRLYKRQRNFCVALLKREKRNYYNNLDLSVFKDIKKIWRSIKPLFSDKQKLLDKNIVIMEDGIIYSDNTQVAEKLNKFFIEAVNQLEIEPCVSEESIIACVGNIEEIVKKYTYHPSILQIKENVILGDKFTFKNMIPQDISDKIINLESKKASIENDIPAKMLIESHDVVSTHLSNIYNNAKNKMQYPGILKQGTIRPINKTKTKTFLKKDYRPISLIPIVSKVYEKNMYDQIYTYMDKFLSPYLFEYRKNHSTEQSNYLN